MLAKYRVGALVLRRGATADKIVRHLRARLGPAFREAPAAEGYRLLFLSWGG